MRKEVHVWNSILWRDNCRLGKLFHNKSYCRKAEARVNQGGKNEES
jgi:hypothetical protein